MGYTQKLGLLAQSVFQDSSLNVGIGGAPSGSYKFEVTGTAKVSGILTLSSTISNGTYTYTLPSATGTLALTSSLSSYVPYTGATASLEMGNGAFGIQAGQFIIFNRAGSNSIGSSAYQGFLDAAQANGVYFQLNASNNLGIFGRVSGTTTLVASISATGNFSGVAATFSSLTTGAVYASSGTLTNTAPSITATGGTITTTGGFKYHTFNSSGTFQVTAGSGLVEVFVLAGGGGGGGDFSGSTFYAGGGGAGGAVYNQGYYVEIASYTVTIGAGGVGNAGSDGFGGNGSNSVFGLITAIGGGGGSKGNADAANSAVGKNGGNGGGGGSGNGVGGITTQSIGTGVPYGNNGANANNVGGGGGGIGTISPSASFGGYGKYIFNLASRIGGGGGGGTFANGGDNGNDGGGRGGYYNGSSSSNSSGTAGTANTGAGGGGLGYNVGAGGTGGSGIVIVRYKA